MFIDLWDSQEDLDRFAQTLIPIMQQLRIQVTESVVYPVHDMVIGKK